MVLKIPFTETQPTRGLANLMVAWGAPSPAGTSSPVTFTGVLQVWPPSVEWMVCTAWSAWLTLVLGCASALWLLSRRIRAYEVVR